MYRQVSNVRHGLVGNIIVDLPDVGAAPIISSFSTGFSGLVNDNYKTRREHFKFRDLVRLILDVWRYVSLTRSAR